MIGTIRLVPDAIYRQCRPYLKRYDWQGVLPQSSSIAGALIVACRSRAPGDWSIWLTTDTRTCWQRFRNQLALPTWTYDYSKETEIRWLNAKPISAGLSVREAIIAGTLPQHLELLAFAVGPSPRRIWFHDRSHEPDGTEYGTSPILYACLPSKTFQPTPASGAAAGLHNQHLARAGKREYRERSGVVWR